MKKIPLFLLILFAFSCSSSESPTNPDDSNDDSGTDNPNETPTENIGQEIGYNVDIFYERLSEELINEFYQVDIDKQGNISDPINLNQEMGVGESSFIFGDIESDQFFLYFGFKFWQKNLGTGEIIFQNFAEQNPELNDGRGYKNFADLNKFGVLAFYLPENETEWADAVYYSVNGGGLKLVELERGDYRSAEFFDNFIVVVGFNEVILQRQIIVIDTRIDQIVFEFETQNSCRTTILDNNLYIIVYDEDFQSNYVVYDTFNFEKIDEGTYNGNWAENHGFGSLTFKTKYIEPEVLTKVDYIFPGIDEGPGIYNLEQNDYTHGDDWFLAREDFKEKVYQLIPNFRGFGPYDVDIENKHVVIAYSAFGDGNSIENEGGVLLVDFAGNILAKVDLDVEPEYLIIKD